MNAKQIFIDGLWRQNTGLVVLLGLCPLLAVSGTAVNGIGLGLATTLTLVCSNVAVSLSRRLLRPEIRIPAYVLIIASVVTTVQPSSSTLTSPVPSTNIGSIANTIPSLSRTFG